MELEEMKTMWAKLNTEVSQQNILNEKIVREMIGSKRDRALNSLIRYETIGSAIILASIPLVFYAIDAFKWTYIQTINLYVIIAVLVLAAVAQLWKLFHLFNIDFAQSISTNISKIEKYRIHVNREKIANIVILPLILPMVIEAQRVFPHGIDLWRWMVMGASFLALIIFSVWLYQKFYKNNIEQIKESMEKLKDLDDIDYTI